MPFGADDLMFYWEDNVLDPNVTPLNGASPETFGEGTTLEKVDDVTVKMELHRRPSRGRYLRARLRHLLPAARRTS